MARVKFGKGSFYDDASPTSRFLSAKDIEYAKPGSVASFYNWTPDTYRSTWDKIMAGTDKNSKHIQKTIQKYTGNKGINIATATPQQLIDVLDFAYREEGRNQQNKGSLFSDIWNVVNPVNNIGTIAGLALGGPLGVGAVLGGSIGNAAQTLVTGKSPVVEAITKQIAPKTNGTPAPPAADVAALKTALDTAKKAAQEKEAQRVAAEQERIAREKAAQEAKLAEERRLAEIAATKKRQEDARNTAFTNTRNATNAYFTDRNLNPNDYKSYIDTILNSAFGAVPTYIDDPGSFLKGNYGEQAAGQARSANVDKYSAALNDLFAPGFSTSRLPNTYDDEFLNSILEDQFGVSRQGFDRSYARGNLNESGYNTAISELTKQRDPALSYLQDIGQGVLTQGRTSLNDFATTAFGDLNNYQLGQNFSVDNYKTGLDSLMNDFASTYKGKIRGALGDQNLFDTATVQQRAGAAQGVTNDKSNALIDALAEKERESNKSRGLGSQGVF